MATKKATQNADVLAMNIRKGQIILVGDAPLIVHAWSAKAKQEILDKQMKKAKQAKEAKDPDQLFQDALYHLPDGKGYGFPAVGFKAAAVDACSHVSDMTKVEARGAFHIQGEMVPLEYEELRQRQDMVRIGMGTADIRIRPEFTAWRVTFEVRYNSSVISLE